MTTAGARPVESALPALSLNWLAIRHACRPGGLPWLKNKTDRARCRGAGGLVFPPLVMGALWRARWIPRQRLGSKIVVGSVKSSVPHYPYTIPLLRLIAECSVPLHSTRYITVPVASRTQPNRHLHPESQRQESLCYYWGNLASKS